MDPEELVSVQAIRDEVEQIKANVFDNPQQVVDFKTLQAKYDRLTNRVDQTMDRVAIESELDGLRNLYFATLALGGILLAVLGIPWGGMHLTPEAPTYSMRAHGGLPAYAGGV